MPCREEGGEKSREEQRSIGASRRAVRTQENYKRTKLRRPMCAQCTLLGIYFPSLSPNGREGAGRGPEWGLFTRNRQLFAIVFFFRRGGLSSLFGVSGRAEFNSAMNTYAAYAAKRGRAGGPPKMHSLGGRENSCQAQYSASRHLPAGPNPYTSRPPSSFAGKSMICRPCHMPVQCAPILSL